MSLFLPVVCLGLLVLIVSALPRRSPTGPLPPPLNAQHGPTSPLPPDRRAHLAWLLENSDDEQIQLACLRQLEDDNWRRGRGGRAVRR